MNFKSFPRRVAIHLLRWLITRVGYVDHSWYMKLYVVFLRRLGYNLTGTPRYISGNTRIDGTDPSLITIGDDVVISSDVRILTHDFSVARIDQALSALHGGAINRDDERKKVAAVSIGDNSFVGAFSLLMPGTIIGRDCIIGAGSVVRGRVPDGSVVLGNPGQIIRSIYPDRADGVA
jgi:acetyltransferase-like isoleucine patch superfamily enzyme